MAEKVPMRVKKRTGIPKFKNREEEARFWDTHSLFEFPEEIHPVGKDFDAYVYRSLRRGFPAKDGWKIAYEVEMPGRGKPLVDFLLTRDGERIVVEVKTASRLTSQALLQAFSWAFEGLRVLLFCPRDTQITRQAREMAKKMGIQIVKTRYRGTP
jgi:hypothetical protein